LGDAAVVEGLSYVLNTRKVEWMADEKRKRLYCNSCKQYTNHKLKGEHKGVFDNGSFSEGLNFRLWICMGCEWGLLEEGYWVEGDEAETLTYSPERTQHSLEAKQYSKLKPKLQAIYKEAIACFNAKALILSAVGLRALLEGICQDKRIRGNNLKAKIDGLQEYLPNKNIIRNLHHFRFMGNDAVHRLAVPKAAEVASAVGVIEDLLNFLYELDYKAAQLREMRRSRKPKSAKAMKAPSATLTLTVSPNT
jgi:hypothetical protein